MGWPAVPTADPLRLASGRGASWPEVLAVGAVADVELEADDWPQHRVGAVDQLAVDDCVQPEVGRDGGRAAAVPADAMTFFGGHDGAAAS